MALGHNAHVSRRVVAAGRRDAFFGYCVGGALASSAPAEVSLESGKSAEGRAAGEKCRCRTRNAHALAVVLLRGCGQALASGRPGAMSMEMPEMHKTMACGAGTRIVRDTAPSEAILCSGRRAAMDWRRRGLQAASAHGLLLGSASSAGLCWALLEPPDPRYATLRYH